LHDDDVRTGADDAVRAAFDRMSFPMASLEGPDHRFVACNAAWRAVVGHPEMIGRPLRDVSPEAVGQQLVDWLDQTLAAGAPARLREWRVQVGAPGAGQELFLDATARPWRRPDGTVGGLDVCLFDVTERVHRRTAQAPVADAPSRGTSRDVVTALQRELLPTGLPVVPQARLSAAYLLSAEGQATGGDWFDALVLPDGRVAVAVGDVVGHGVPAAVTMGQLSAVLQHALRETDGDIARALRQLDRAARHVPGAHATTVAVAVLSPRDGRLLYGQAGHPPPLLVDADGVAHFLPPATGGPLGTSSTFVPAETRMHAGDVLVLYTDGLVERPGRDHAASMVELARVVGDVHGGRALVERGLTDVERLCTQTLELLVRPTGHTDDITLLALGRQDAVRDLDLEVPAEPASLAQTRRAVARWLRRAGADSSDVTAMQLVVGELLTNSVEHAYAQASASHAAAAATVRVHLHLSAAGVLEAEVADRGRWRSAASEPGRGRGLVLSTRLVDSLVIDRGGTGTTVRVRQRLTATARVLTDHQLSSLVAVPEATVSDERLLLVLDQPRAGSGYVRYSRRLRVDGPLDAMTAPELAIDLSSEVARGAPAVLLDLTGVSHLASAGVAALFAAADEARRGGMELSLYAPLGSTAQQIMALVEMPHLTVDPEDGPAPTR
jgi:anti-anti-sigma factor